MDSLLTCPYYPIVYELNVLVFANLWGGHHVTKRKVETQRTEVIECVQAVVYLIPGVLKKGLEPPDRK